MSELIISYSVDNIDFKLYAIRAILNSSKFEVKEESFKGHHKPTSLDIDARVFFEHEIILKVLGAIHSLYPRKESLSRGSNRYQIDLIIALVDEFERPLLELESRHLGKHDT